MKTIGFIGAGNMAQALGGGLRSEADFALTATDPSPDAVAAFEKASGGAGRADVAALAADADVIVLAVKPQIMPQVLSTLADALRPQHLVVSIAAGIGTKTMVAALGADARVVRVMPNTPSLVGEGMSVLVGGGKATAEDLSLCERICGAAGETVVVEDEALLDAVTAVSGSGPGFLFAYGEAMLEAAEHAGLDRDLAVVLVRQTLFGSAKLWRESDQDVSTLRQNVTSPGGTTQAGLEALDARGFAAAIRAAVDAATRRSKELSAG